MMKVHRGRERLPIIAVQFFGTKGTNFMSTILRRTAALVALTVGIGVAGGTADAVAATHHATSKTTNYTAARQTVRPADWWFSQ